MMPFTLEDAIEAAVRLHKGQKDKLGEPYILHPLRVMLALPKNRPELRMIAVLHDVLEDTPITAEGLRLWGVPKNVVETVEILTHPRHEPYVDYINRVKRSKMATIVKLADIEDNLRSDRLIRLPKVEIERLIEKYDKAIEILRG